MLACSDCADNINSMTTLDASNAEEVLAFVKPIMLGLDRSFEHGISVSDSFFAPLGPEAYDAYLAAMISRRFALLEMRKNLPSGWRLKRLRNSGMELTSYPVQARVLMSQDGQVPHPGHSASRKDFYSQAGQMALPMSSGYSEIQVPTNLIIHWSVTADRSVNFVLCKPIGTWKYRGKPVFEWEAPIFIDPSGEVGFVVAEEDVTVEYLGEPGPEKGTGEQA